MSLTMISLFLIHLYAPLLQQQPTWNPSEGGTWPPAMDGFNFSDVWLGSCQLLKNMLYMVVSTDQK